MREAVVLQLFQDGTISSGKAAEFLDISKDAFRALLHERRIPYFRQSPENVLRDADLAASLKPD